MNAMNLPGPPELLPGLPDAVVDLQTELGIKLVKGQWRYSDAEIHHIDFFGVGEDLGPSGPPNRTYDIIPHAQATDFDDSGWAVLPPEDTERRLSTGKVCFNWYRIQVTIPDKVGDFDPTGATVIFEVVIDDYAEVWVNGQLNLSLGQTGGQVAAGFNAPNRVMLTQSAEPGQQFQIAVFGINGPISVSPENYIWMRTATLDFYSTNNAYAAQKVFLDIDRVDPKLDVIIPDDAKLEKVAGGFVFTEGPIWVNKENALLFSSPNTNVIYRWLPVGKVELFRAKSGYSGVDIGRYTQPGSNGLTFDPQGRLTICQHGNRRVIRVEPRGNITVMIDHFEGQKLNSPNDLVYRSDGALYLTDPPFGLPDVFDDEQKGTPFSGVYLVKDGKVALLDDALTGPNGIAFSPDEKYLYVGNWDMEAKIIKRYAVYEDGTVSHGETFFDMTNAPGEDAIDGIKVDQQGNLYVCGPGGIWIISSEGEQLGLLKLPEDPHNLAWGDEDGKTLFITALTSIYRLRLNIAGIRPDF